MALEKIANKVVETNVFAIGGGILALWNVLDGVPEAGYRDSTYPASLW